MSTHRNIDRICAAAVLCCLLLTLLFANGEALGLQTASRTAGYASKLFSTDRVHTVNIVMDGWDSFLETCENEEYAACSVVIDGEAYKNVGIRAKGNTSLSTVSQMGSDRYSFKIEFDCYDSAKTYYGLDKLCLNNVIQDNTYMKDYLTYRLMGEFGVNAPLCSYVYITVNGEDWGLYLAVEGVEDGFLRRNYGGDHGELYKPDSMSFGAGRGNGRDFDMQDFIERGEGEQGEGQSRAEAIQRPGEQGGAGGGLTPPGQDAGASEDFAPPGQGAGAFGPGEASGGMGSDDVKLKYTDDDPDSYANIFDNAKTDVSDADMARLIRALKILSGDGDASDALDVDQVLRYFVVHNFVVNGDSYTGSMVHNYYLYEQDGLLSMIPWDYNLAFGTFQGGDADRAVNDPIDSPLSVTGSGDRPMADWIFADETYAGLYHQYFAEFLNAVDPAALIEQAFALIAPYVEKDPTKFCTYEEFEAGVDALKTFCALREQSVSGQLAGTVPSTSAGQAADPAALVDASTLNLSNMGTMNNKDGNSAIPAMGAFPGFGDRTQPPDGTGGGEQPGNGEMPTSPPSEGLPQQSSAASDGASLPGNSASGSGQPGDRFPGEAGAGVRDSGASRMETPILLGVSVLVLLAGLLAAFRFKRW